MDNSGNTPHTLPHFERELLLARLARIEALIQKVQQTCDASAALRDTFVALEQELAAAATTLRPVHRGLHGDPE